MSKLNLFSTVGTPIAGAWVNGIAIPYIANINLTGKEMSVNIPGLGKVSVSSNKIAIGVISEAIFIALLIPFKDFILSIFCGDYEIENKWEAHVLASSLFSIVIIGLIASIKYFIVYNKINDKEDNDKNRDDSTVKNLTK